MSDMIEIGIVGAKNSGKTTLIVELVRELTSLGFRVATIKHTHHRHELDVPGKDSHRHRQAGAALTVAISKSEIALYADPESENVALARELIAQRVDLCLVEGNKQAARPKVLLMRNLESLKHEIPDGIVASYGPGKHNPELDHFELNDTDGLAKYLIERYCSAKLAERMQNEDAANV